MQEVDKDRQKRKESEAAAGSMEEFDPYAKSWHGSQYGSRYCI